MPSKLKPLKNLGAFDGDKYKADLPRDIPLPRPCSHAAVTLVSASELRCSCGAAWSGPSIITLYRALKAR